VVQFGGHRVRVRKTEHRHQPVDLKFDQPLDFAACLSRRQFPVEKQETGESVRAEPKVGERGARAVADLGAEHLAALEDPRERVALAPAVVVRQER